MRVTAFVKIKDESLPLFYTLVRNEELGYWTRHYCPKTQDRHFEVTLMCGQNKTPFILKELERLET